MARYRRFAITCIAMLGLLIIPTTAPAQEPAVVEVCTELMRGGLVKDEHNLQLSSDQFYQLQRVIASKQFSSYQEFSNWAGHAGLSIPVLDDLLGLNRSTRDSYTRCPRNTDIARLRVLPV